MPELKPGQLEFPKNEKVFSQSGAQGKKALGFTVWCLNFWTTQLITWPLLKFNDSGRADSEA